MKKILLAAALFVALFASSSFAQDLDAEFEVGNTSCVIVSSKTGYTVYWDQGTGNTLLVFNEELPNGNITLNEYESDGDTYTGQFIFKDYNCNTGTYIRNDGKKFKVRKIN